MHISNSSSASARQSISFSGRKHIIANTLKAEKKLARQRSDSASSDSFAASSSSSGSLANSVTSLDSSVPDSASSTLRSSMRNVSAEDVRQVLTRLGFKTQSQKGSHVNMVSSKCHRSVTVPDHGSARQPMKPGTLNKILNQTQEILEEEAVPVPNQGGGPAVSKDSLLSWVNEPKSYRHEIDEVVRRLQVDSNRKTQRRNTFSL